MKVPVAIDKNGDLVLAHSEQTSMYIEIDDSLSPALADAPVGTPIRIVDSEESGNSET